MKNEQKIPYTNGQKALLVALLVLLALVAAEVVCHLAGVFQLPEYLRQVGAGMAPMDATELGTIGVSEGQATAFVATTWRWALFVGAYLAVPVACLGCAIALPISRHRVKNRAKPSTKETETDE